MLSSELPNYITNGVGLPSIRTPYEIRDAKIASLLFKADRQQLKRLCDRYLNDSVDSPYHYRPLLSHVMLPLARLEGRVLNESGQAMGWLPETDLGFWILTVAMRRITGGGYVPNHLAWFIPTLYVDLSYAQVSGREVLGFNKEFATFDQLGTFQDPEYTASVFGFKRFGEDVVGKTDWLINVRRVDESRTPPAIETWENKEQAAEQFINLLSRDEPGQLGSVAVDWLDDAIDLMIYLFKPEVRMVFLKQFRDAEHSLRACYQAVVEAPGRLTDFKGGGLIRGRYELHVNELQSHPIARDIGLKLSNGKQIARAAFWVDMAFTIEAGQVLGTST